MTFLVKKKISYLFLAVLFSGCGFHASLSINLGSTPVAPPTLLSLSGPAAALATACAGPYALTTLNASGNATAVAKDTLINLTTSAGNFYSNSSCSTSITKLTLTAATNTTNFYFINPVMGSVTLQADSDGLSSATFPILFVTASPVSFILTGPATGTTAQCLAYTVTSADNLSNPIPVLSDTAVNLSDGGTGGFFYSDSACGSPISSSTLFSGISSTIIYYKKTGVGTSTLTFSAFGLSSASATVTVGYSSATLLGLTGSSNITTASCAPYSVIGKDSSLAVGTFSSNAVVSLSDGGLGGTFYSDPSCTLPITTLLEASGTNSATFYYQNLSANTVTLGASATGFTSGSMSISVVTAPANHLTFSGPYGVTTVLCSAYTVISQNSVNATVSVGSDTPITLSDGGAGGIFYSNSTCTTTLPSISILSGNSSTSTFYYKKTLAGPLTLQASATGYSPALTNVTDTVGPSAILTISNTLISPASVLNCLSYTVTSQDAFGNVANVQTNISIALSGAGTAGAFYSNSSCSSSTSSITMTAGTSSKGFYYKKTQPGTVTVLASRSGMAIGSQTVTIIAGPPYQLSFTTAPTLIASNTCTNYRVSIKDQASNIVNAVSSIPVTVDNGSDDGTFYTTSSCGTALTSPTIPSGSSQLSFYYKKSNSSASTEAVTLNAASMSLTTGTSVGVTVTTGIPSVLVYYSGNTSIVQNSCAAYTLQTRDEGSLAANTSTGLTVNLSSSGGNDAFYSDSVCSSIITSTTISSGTSSKTFYYKMTSPPSTPVVATLTASATFPNSTVSSPTRAVTVSSGVAQTLVFTSGPSSFAINSCVSFTISTRDENSIVSNVTSDTLLNLSGAGSNGAFYSNSACTTPANSVTITSGTSSKVFYYMNTATIGAQTLQGAANSFTSGTKAVTVTVGPAAALAVTAGNTSFSAGTCQSYTVTPKDSGNNTVNAASNITVNLGGAGPGVFYVDTNCTAAVSSITLLSGSNSQLFFYEATSPGSTTFTVGASGLASGSYNVTAN